MSGFDGSVANLSLLIFTLYITEGLSVATVGLHIIRKIAYVVSSVHLPLLHATASTTVENIISADRSMTGIGPDQPPMDGLTGLYTCDALVHLIVFYSYYA